MTIKELIRHLQKIDCDLIHFSKDIFITVNGKQYNIEGLYSQFNSNSVSISGTKKGKK